MFSHPQYLGLMADILADPTDYTPRLVLTDWLRDHGAEQLADWHGKALAGDAGGRTRIYRSELARVRESIGDLLPSKGFVYLGNQPALRQQKRLTEWLGRSSWLVSGRDICLVVRYGFLSEIGCSQKLFLRIGPELVRRQPIADVRFIGDTHTGEVLVPGTQHWWQAWHEMPKGRSTPRNSELSPGIFSRLRPARKVEMRRGYRAAYPDQYQAFADASFAAVNWARSEAGLTPMPRPVLAGAVQDDRQAGAAQS